MAPRIDLSERRQLRWRFADASFDEASLPLTVAGQPVELERRPLQLLALLLAHTGEIVTKEEILEALWPGREVSEASLTTCMTRLRQALGEAGHACIRTVHGYGYRFAAPVTVEATAPAPAAASAVASLTPGDPVPHRPDWRLVQSLGSGGYGDAWLAERAKSHERRVIKFARDGDGLAALRREVALGRLLREGLGPRPDLVRILDWHFADPPCFIETVWAEAGNLADWAARQGGAASLPLDLRIDLAAQIAEALAAIHGMAVLHKDLKPANILIRLDDAKHPAIILTDFGSGRALDPARLDAFGITRPEPDRTGADSTAGTQIYRAPELSAGGAPTVQADIFALGVVLFQLVAGDFRRPLTAGWEELVPDPLLREDIAATAAGDPARRLADAKDIATRLRALPARRAARNLAEAEAAEAARTRRALELARARRTPLLALVAVLVLALATSTTLYIRARHAEAAAEAVTAFLTDDLFSAANPALGADPNIPVRRVLGIATADLDHRFPPGSAARAAIEAAIGSAYAGLADPQHALPLLRSALTKFRAELGDSDPQTQAIRLTMGVLAEHQLDNEAMRQAGLDMLAAHPADAGTELAARFFVLIANCGTNGNSDACARQLTPFLAETRSRLGPLDPFTLKVQGELARRLGDVRHFAQAVPMARQTLAQTQSVYGPDHLLTQEARFELATVLVQAGQIEEAIAILPDIRRRMLAMAGSETDMSARVINQLGMAYMFAQRYPESLNAYQVALDYTVKTRGQTAALAVAALNNIANTLVRMGRPRDAIPLARKNYDLHRQLAGDDDPDTLWSEHNLAKDYAAEGDMAESETLFRDLVARARRVFTHGEYYLGLYEAGLGEVLAHENKNDEARAQLADALLTFTTSVGPTDEHTLHTQALLASLPR